jgi:uncharacterized protein YbbK (DUF523 family)
MGEPARILVSACLIGQPVRYDGRGRRVEDATLARWQAEGRLVPFCPEVAGGLPTPRPAAEITPGGDGAAVLAGAARIVTREGADVTAAFIAGARLTVLRAKESGCRFALLAEGSPSCGSGFIHDGTFSGRRVTGAGVTATMLREAGIAVFAPDGIADLARALDSVVGDPA